MDDLNGIPEKDFEKISKYLEREKTLEYIKKKNTTTKLFRQSYYCLT